LELAKVKESESRIRKEVEEVKGRV